MKCSHEQASEKEEDHREKNAATSITIWEILREKDGQCWVTHRVQGWKEDGKWKRKQFKDRKEAERFFARKQVEMENKGRKQQMIPSPNTEAQAQEAVSAFDALGDTYSLKLAVEFFLANHRPPGFVTTTTAGIGHYLDDKERDGIRDRTIRGIKGAHLAFAKATDDPHLHTVTHQMVETYLRSLRSADGTAPAKRKSWNTHRNEISQFFAWAMKQDLNKNRPWCFTNPVSNVKQFSTQQVAEQRPAKATTSPEDLQHMLSFLMRYQVGNLVKFFALSYFAGIRPEGELEKLAKREKELINLKTRCIAIPAHISKTKADRQVVISDNLFHWLTAYKGFPIIPVNFKTIQSKVRTHFELKRDETRHSFISYHVAVHRSVGDVALQAGNSESMVRKHYLRLHTREEGAAFFSIIPDRKRRLASLATDMEIEAAPNHLKAI